MNKPQLSYSAQITSPTQTQTIEVVRKTLSAQSELLNGWSVSSKLLTSLDELQALFGIWSSETGDFDELDVSILTKTSEIDASISTTKESVVSASDKVHSISIDWEHFDRQQFVRNEDQLELPIKIEIETKRSIGDLCLSCNQTGYIVLTDDHTSIAKIIDILGKNELTIEQFGTTNLCYIAAHVDPQKVKLNLEYCLLFINGVEIPFRENTKQMKLLRAMFGKQGKNRIKLEFDVLYDIYAKDENDYISWERFCRIDDGKQKDAFIKQVRNNASAINNRIRKFIGWTEDFLEIKDHACRINPRLIHKT